MKKNLSVLAALLAVATSASAQNASAVMHGLKDGIGAYTAIHGLFVIVPEPSALTFIAVGAAGLILAMRRYK
ncbi:MAG TPA: hypothetical protein VGN23_08550 [Verrucomicrobiae bacterium]|jgi:hypothetical protein